MMRIAPIPMILFLALAFSLARPCQARQIRGDAETGRDPNLYSIGLGPGVESLFINADKYAPPVESIIQPETYGKQDETAFELTGRSRRSERVEKKSPDGGESNR